jgi:hypothetical protein
MIKSPVWEYGAHGLNIFLGDGGYKQGIIEHGKKELGLFV